MKLVVTGLVVGFVFGYFLSKQLTPEKVKYVDKIKVVESKNVRTVTVTKTIPGETITRTETIDLSKTNLQQDLNREAVKNIKSQWLIGPSIGLSFDKTDPTYGLVVERRILGPVFVGAYGNTQGVGLMALFEF